MKKRIFILQGNPDNEGSCGEFANHYEEGARIAGHEVKRVNIGDLKFDPVLHKGYKTIQELEPDLKMVQDHIKWCDHFVLLYPTWWSGMPAVLKGFFDRAWLPGFAFHFHKHHMGWDKLLHGRSAHVIVTMDSWPLISRFLFGDSTNEIGRAILKFGGFRPVHIQKIGHLEGMSELHKNRIKNKMFEMGKMAK